MRHLRAPTFRPTTPEIVAIALVLGASTFAVYYASKILSLNPDALISVYLFQHGPILGDLFIADWHTNLLKWPLLLLQAKLPFTMLMFTLMNTILVVATLLGWSLASALACGRRYFAPVAIALAVLTIGSAEIPNEIAFTTIRNIEYPFFFLLIIGFWRLVTAFRTEEHIAPRTWLWGALYIVSMAILVASDPFFAYAGIPALGVMVAGFAWRQKWHWKSIASSLGLVVIPYGVAKLLLLAMEQWHVFRYYGESFSPPLYAPSELPASLWRSLGDLLFLYNGNVWGPQAKSGMLNHIILGGLLLISLAAFGRTLKKLPRLAAKNPPFATILLSSIFVWGSYVTFTGMQHQYRYVVLIALVITLALVVQLKPIVPKLSSTWWLGLSVVVLALMGWLCLRQYQAAQFDHFAEDKASLQQIGTTLAGQQVGTIVTGHTYAGLLKFWSAQAFAVAPVLYCNQNLPFLTRASWYQNTSSTTAKVAIVVDRQGRDANSWYCSERRLLEYYGPPQSHHRQAGLQGTSVDIFIYPDDILHKIQVITTPGKPLPKLAN